MKFNQWTMGLAAVGTVSLASAARADEQMSQVQTALTQTTLSGYVDTAAQWNPNTDMRPGVPYPGHVPFYSFAKDDGFSLNAVDIALDRSEDSSQWAAGYRVEVMTGADSVGIGMSGGPGRTGSTTLRQGFIRLHMPLRNGIDWQIGVWDSPIGYESNSDPLNPNYTRSYGYTIEPNTSLGILGTYKVNDQILVSAGIANNEFASSFVPENAFESMKCYLGSISLTAPDNLGFLKGANLSIGAIHNNNSSFPGVALPGATTSLYAGVTLPTPIKQLKVGASFDYLFENDYVTPPPLVASTTGSDLWAVAGYATFQATDKLSLSLRAEYFDDKDANNIMTFFPGGPVITSKSDVVLYPTDNAEAITATVQYNLWANVITRAEFRWDHVEHGKWFGVAGTTPTFIIPVPVTSPPDRSNDFLLALNVIYQF